MSAEELRAEAVLIADKCPHGSHVKVAEECGISVVYLGKLRSTENPTDTEAKRDLYKQLIKSYRKILNKHIKDLQSVA